MKSAALSLNWFTVLKAFDRSFATSTVRRVEGRCMLKPDAKLCTSGNRVEVVDFCLQKSCWCLRG